MVNTDIKIDFILCSQRWRSCIQSAESRRGADCGSDHELLIAKFRLKLKKVVMYGCESCTIKKAECGRIDAFELWCWRILLKVPWTARRFNQSILKETGPEYSLERLDGEAETPTLWPPDGKNWFIGKDPDSGKDWSQKEKGVTKDEIVGWHHWLNG